MNSPKLKEIAWKYLTGTATEKEKSSLHHWYDSTCDENESSLPIASGENKDQVARRIYRRLRSGIGAERIANKSKSNNNVYQNTSSISGILCAGIGG